jgi:hypothetical protein
LDASPASWPAPSRKIGKVSCRHASAFGAMHAPPCDVSRPYAYAKDPLWARTSGIIVDPKCTYIGHSYPPRS